MSTMAVPKLGRTTFRTSRLLDFCSRWEDGLEVGGRACFERGQPVLQQEVRGSRFNDYNRTRGWKPWFEEAGWVDETAGAADQAVDP